MKQEEINIIGGLRNANRKVLNTLLNLYFDNGFYILCNNNGYRDFTSEEKKYSEEMIIRLKNFIYDENYNISLSQESNMFMFCEEDKIQKIKNIIDEVSKDSSFEITNLLFFGNDKNKFKEFLFDNAIMVSPKVAFAENNNNELYGKVLEEMLDEISKNNLLSSYSTQILKYIENNKDKDVTIMNKMISTYKEGFLKYSSQDDIAKWFYTGYEEQKQDKFKEIYYKLTDENKRLLIINSASVYFYFPFLENELVNKLKNPLEVKALDELVLEEEDKKILEYYKNNKKANYKIKNLKYSAVFYFDLNEMKEAFPFISEDIFSEILSNLEEEIIRGKDTLRIGYIEDGDKKLIVLSSNIQLSNEEFESYILNNIVTWIRETEDNEYSKKFINELFNYIKLVRSKNLYEKIEKTNSEDSGRNRRKAKI